MPNTALMPLPKQQFLSTLGVPLVGGKVYTYAAGTNNPKATYTDQAGTINQPNPIPLNLRGEPDSAIYWSGAYKVEVRDALGNVVYTVDNFNTDPAGVWSILTNLAAAAGAKLIGFIASIAGAKARNVQDKLRDIVSVKDTGAAGDGATDDSTAILDADGSGAKVRYPKGSYKFTSATNPAFAGGIEFDNATVVGTRAGNQKIVVADKSGRLIGLQHNHKEQRLADFAGVNTAITTGKILPPPVSNANIHGPVDILAHWYNDFGLECVRAANSAIGALTWYYWDWNHSDNAFDPKRKPLLGFYRGDDANVLDWQCYWLREHGVTGVVIDAPALRTATWANASSTNRDFWVYQLFNNVPNFQGLRYVLSMAYNTTAADIAAQWTDAINNVYLKNPNFYAVRKNGKLWPVVFIYDMGIMRAGVFDAGGGSVNTEAHLKNMAALFQAAGFGGMCIIGRNAGYYTDAASYNNLAQLEQAGIIMYGGEYAKTPGETGAEATYDDYLTNFAQTSWRTLPNVCTSHQSKAPHPSGWTQAGSTPAKFNKLLQKAVNAALNNPNAPPIVTVYNVSEWAEGGASLQPNMADGFGYLEAVRAVMTGGVREDRALPYSLMRVDGSAVNIKPVGDTIGIYTTFGVTLAAAPYLPTIAPGYNGQKIRLINIPAIGNYTIGFNDNATTAGTNLFLQATTVVLGPYDSMELTYISGKGWEQTSAVSNVL